MAVRRVGILFWLAGCDVVFGLKNYPVWLSPDGCELFYVSKLADLGSLYVARR